MLVSCIAVWSVFGFHTGVCGGAWVLVGSIFSGFAAFSWTLILVWDDPIWPSLRLRGSQVHQMLIISYQILEQDPHVSQDPTQETRSIWWGRSTSTKTTPSWKNGGASDYGGEMWKWLTYSCLHFFFMRLQAGDSWWRVLQLHCSILLYYFFRDRWEVLAMHHDVSIWYFWTGDWKLHVRVPGDDAGRKPPWKEASVGQACNGLLGILFMIFVVNRCF